MNFHKQSTPVLIKAFIKNRVITSFPGAQVPSQLPPCLWGNHCPDPRSTEQLGSFLESVCKALDSLCSLLSGVLCLMLGLGDARLLASPWSACPGHPWATGVTQRRTDPLHRRWGQCLAIVRSTTSNVFVQPSNCFPKLYQFILLPEMYGVLAVPVFDITWHRKSFFILAPLTVLNCKVNLHVPD